VTDREWEILQAVLRGERIRPIPVGFIIDSPWLPNWAGISILDYYSSDDLWLKANLKAIHEFPDCIFLPGFWSEYGMCTEPSAFGARCLFPENEFPFADKVIASVEEIDRLEKPDPRKHGLLPFVIKRLKHCQPAIEDTGHRIRFAVSRGPLNIASFLMGSTEFLIEMRSDPDRIHRLLKLVTAFILDWVEHQRECFPSIDGLLLLDDIVGFIGEKDFREFALPHLKEIFTRSGVKVRFFHNDAPCKSSARYLAEAGINLYNMGIQSTLQEIRAWTSGEVALVGNIPPRDILASGTVEEVETAVRNQYGSLADRSGVVFSCGGGMPPGVPSENIHAFVRQVRSLD
jgi:uroporphyrinogen-III decarboxylase